MARILRTTVPQLVFVNGPIGIPAAAKSAGTTTGAITRTAIYIPSAGAKIAKFWFSANTVGSSSAGSYITITPIKKGAGTTTAPNALADGATALTTFAVGALSGIALGPALGGGGAGVDAAGCTEGDEIDFYCVHTTTCTTGPTGLVFNVLWQL